MSSFSAIRAPDGGPIAVVREKASPLLARGERLARKKQRQRIIRVGLVGRMGQGDGEVWMPMGRAGILAGRMKRGLRLGPARANAARDESRLVWEQMDA
jgi:hypothetical protein